MYRSAITPSSTRTSLYTKRAQIGDDFYAHSHAAVRESIAASGTASCCRNSVVVGGDGFGFAKRADGTHAKMVQSGVIR